MPYQKQVVSSIKERRPEVPVIIYMAPDTHSKGGALIEKLDQLSAIDKAVSRGVRNNGFAHELKKLWFDTHVKGEVASRALRHYAHPDKLVMGTNLGGFDTPDALVSDAAHLSKNARRLLRLP